MTSPTAPATARRLGRRRGSGSVIARRAGSASLRVATMSAARRCWFGRWQGDLWVDRRDEEPDTVDETRSVPGHQYVVDRLDRARLDPGQAGPAVPRRD